MPVPALRFSVSDGRAALDWAAAGADAATVPRPIARATKAVPRRARRVLLRLVILACSHRNDGDIIAAGDADDRTDRSIASGDGPLATGLALGRLAG